MDFQPGDNFKYQTSAAAFIGTAVAVGGGYVVGVLRAVSARRVDGVEVEEIGPPSTTPVVLPVEDIEVVS